MTNTGILVCNASAARFFLNEGCGKGMSLVTDWEHPDSRKHEGDFVTGSAGRVQQSYGHGARPGIEWKTSPKETEMQHFAAELVDYLQNSRMKAVFEHLIIVAPPHFLGLLREKLDDPTRTLLRDTLDKDYTQENVSALLKHLADLFCRN